MSPARTHEQALLASGEALLQRALRETGAPAMARLDVLEGVAAQEGGWPLKDYRSSFAAPRFLTTEEAQLWADKLADVLASARVPVPLAIAALARPDLHKSFARTVFVATVCWFWSSRVTVTSVPGAGVGGDSRSFRR